MVWVDDEANLPAEFASADAKYKSISGKFEYKVGGEPTYPGWRYTSARACWLLIISAPRLFKTA